METGDINSVIHLTESIGDGTIATELCASGYYSVILHENTIYGRAYGWQTCDYMGGTLVCLVPQTTGALQLSCSAIAATRLIAFHPDIFHGTFLGKEMTDYSFFSYRTNEALHLSVREKQIIGDCMDAIENEIKEPLDRYSTNVVSKRIGLLLDYCMRFYERQLTTRYLTVQTTLKQYETMVRDFISTRGFRTGEALSLKNCAEQLGLSKAYFCDLLNDATGMSHDEYVNRQGAIFAQKLLRETEYPITRIASDLGFSSARHFSLFFKRIIGCSPQEFRCCC